MIRSAVVPAVRVQVPETVERVELRDVLSALVGLTVREPAPVAAVARPQ
jgi:hypothetical protein